MGEVRAHPQHRQPLPALADERDQPVQSTRRACLRSGCEARFLGQSCRPGARGDGGPPRPLDCWASTFPGPPASGAVDSPPLAVTKWAGVVFVPRDHHDEVEVEGVSEASLAAALGELLAAGAAQRLGVGPADSVSGTGAGHDNSVVTAM